MSAAGGVVVTGSAGGVGFAYAGEFMDRGYDVVICDVRDCSQAAKALAARHPNGNVYHTKCDVSDNASIVKMGAFAKKKLGVIQYWINNAGVNGGRRALRDVPVSQVEMVVKVNLLGTLLCTKVAMDIMAQQVSSNILVVVCSSLPTNVTNIEIYIYVCMPLMELKLKLKLMDSIFYLIHSAWCHWSYFQYSRKWCQGWRNSWIRIVWCHQAWIASIDR